MESPQIAKVHVPPADACIHFWYVCYERGGLRISQCRKCGAVLEQRTFPQAEAN